MLHAVAVVAWREQSAVEDALLQSRTTLCTSISCVQKLDAPEPSWAKLDFQPRIDWAGCGVRGDCVVGELDYILDKYCDPHGPLQSNAWPSEERLRQIDVLSQALGQDGLGAVAALLPNRTLMLMGDSVMEQFYNALQCMLRREGRALPVDAAFRASLDRSLPLWLKGKRKMAPKLPEAVDSGRRGAPMRLLFERAVRMEPEDVRAALLTTDVLVVNCDDGSSRTARSPTHALPSCEEASTH